MAGTKNQVVLKIELVAKTLITKIAVIVTAAVSISKDVFSRSDRIPKSGADPMVGTVFAILNCLERSLIFNIRFL